ncbi:MAG TPA: nucleotide disphospho-sugar-binding domain-containing protein [Pseudonocardia sp.]|nr:nucleotide disphospho-sugar-binding domain-containing protein [Pseudonocardia sp.]
MTGTAAQRFLAALVDGGGTVPPELGAVRSLVERGHDVTVLAEDSVAPEVRATGARLRRWTSAPNRPDRRPENDPYRDWEVSNPLQLFDRLIETQFVGPARGYVADLADAIAEQHPDAVLCSQFALGAMIAAEAAGIPFVVLMPNAYLLPREGAPPFGLGLRPARGVLGRLRDRTISGVIQRQWDRKALPRLNALRAELGLGPLEHFWQQIHHAHAELVMTSAAFDFPAALPATARYVGPVLDDPSWSEPWTPPPGEDPLVLVGLSSTFQDQVGCLQRIADALGTLPVRAVATTGPAIDPSVVQAPPTVSVVASAPHARVLEHAAVTITHGGHGTVIKSLAAGVPLLVIPHGRDQADNAARITARGVGITVPRTARPPAIARALRTLLDDPGYRDRARELGAVVRRDATSGLLVRELERAAAAPAPRRPPGRAPLP